MHRVNYDYYASLHNWVETLSLECTSKTQVGLIGSMFFAGWAISATFLPRLADIYGRNIVYILSMICHSIFIGAIILSHNL